MAIEMVEQPPQEELGNVPESSKTENPEGDLGARPKKPDVIEGEDVLFAPKHDGSGRYILTDLRKEYIELSNIEEFKPLNVWQMYFVWLYANPTSPYNQNQITVLQKRKYCADRAMYQSKNRLRQHIRPEDYENYCSGIYPEEVNLAIKRMETFSANSRLKAKIMAEKMFDDFMEFLNKDKSQITDTEEKKKHVDMCLKILQDLPALIKNVEEGYGIRTTTMKPDAENSKSGTLLDKVFEIEARN